jgi:hypothetical protein
MKLFVPRIRPSDSTREVEEIDQESLFAELHSIVGTLEQDVLHVETRYKHSLVPESNTLTCRVACKVRRPKTDSRWSICSTSDGQASGSNVHERLAKYIISHCPPQQALDLIRYHLGRTASAVHTIDQLCIALETQISEQRSASLDAATDKPSILISDTSLEPDSSIASPAPSDNFSTAPCSPLSGTALTAQTSIKSSGPLLSATPAKVSKRKASPAIPLAHPLISAAKVTTAVSNSYSEGSPADPGSGPDDARALWKHIRQSSLSTLQQLVESKPETLAELEATDDVVKELRRKALANKRSVGAETLRAWHWDDKRSQGGVAPWM